MDSTFGVWLQTDLDSAAQNLMEAFIKVYHMSQEQGSALKLALTLMLGAMTETHAAEPIFL